ncbi:MAG: DUF2284 domain-containing protein [Candidatus Zixiibacteriota bacterium]|jgi:predicted metal-binding protein
MSENKDLGVFCERALERGASWARAVPASYIVTAPWVLHKCKYGCGAYGHNHKCPPRTPAPEETARIIASYERAILVMYESDNPKCGNINGDLVALEREVFLDGYERAAAFGAGPCSLCKECDVSKPCPRGKEARPALEACGIDVYSTFGQAGVTLEVVPDYESPFKLCGAILVD